MGFNSAFKGLMFGDDDAPCIEFWTTTCYILSFSSAVQIVLFIV